MRPSCSIRSRSAFHGSSAAIDHDFPTFSMGAGFPIPSDPLRADKLVRMAKILVVDDEVPVQELLARRLRHWGHDVRTVSSAVEAIEHMQLAAADIVFSDYTMPVNDGIWLAEQVTKKWPDTQVIVVTASEEAGREAKTRQAGASDYVPKPVDRATLYQALQRAIARVEFS